LKHCGFGDLPPPFRSKISKAKVLPFFDEFASTCSSSRSCGVDDLYIGERERESIHQLDLKQWCSTAQRLDVRRYMYIYIYYIIYT